MQMTLKIGDQAHELDIVARSPELLVRLDGQTHVLADGGTSGGLRTMIIDGTPYSFAAAVDQGTVYVHLGEQIIRVEIPDARDAFTGKGASANDIIAPMPGTVVSILRAPGDAVEAGDVVLTIESMKLQMNLSSPRKGRVGQIAVEPNATFNKGDLLVSLTSENEG